MAGPVMNVESGKQFPGGLTFQVCICSIIAAFGGLMFGYDIGISGGVTGMDSFLEKFFPKVYEKKHNAHENNYCKFDDMTLQLFTSSLYLAAIVASYIASGVCKRWGRKPTMMWASIFFLAGALLNFFAQDLPMLIGGRMLLGLGIGFGNLAVPLFISEIAPVRYRGALNIMFQLLITVGILCASILNYFTSKVHKHGWRISLGGAVVPAFALLLGSFVIQETPTSLIERGKEEEGRRVLRKIRGFNDVDLEFQEIKRATEEAKEAQHQYKELFKRENRPAFYCGTILQFFQQFTGINVVMFYAPVLFQTMGNGSTGSLISTIVTNTVNLLATGFAIAYVDKWGRKFFLMGGAGLMATFQAILGTILLTQLKIVGSIGHAAALSVVISICIFVASFACSWGPLGWLVASEIFHLRVRNAGFFFAVGMNMLCTFLIGQFFLTALCLCRSYMFYFFAVVNFIMLLWVKFFLPETKGLHVDEMVDKAWKVHSHWKKYFTD